MGTPPDPATEHWLTELEALAAVQVPTEHATLFGDFLRHYFAASPPDALRLRKPQALLDAAWSHYQLAAVRAPEALGLQLVSAAPYLGPGLAAIDSVTDDMPFLVDSIAMAIRAAGSSIDWSVHPIIAVQRDPQGRLTAVDSAAGASGQWARESLIHVEFESLPNAQADDQLQKSLHECLADLRIVVGDFARMRARLRELIAELAGPLPGVDQAELDEAQRFLEWLDENNFTFLGIAETQARRMQDGGMRFNTVDSASLGLARTGTRFADPDQLIAPAAELDKYVESTRVIVITKANHRSTIHHPDYIDVVSVRRFHADGSVRGICRFMGLFASQAYTERPRHIPLVRRKMAEVLRRSGLTFDSHSGKNLREIMHQLPRDELFQSSEDELFQTCAAIRALRDRHQLRFLMRRDRYGRFYSCMVYLPRERYTREIRDRIEDELIELFSATGVDRNTEFLRHGLARIHYIVRTRPGTTIALDAASIEGHLLRSIRSWRDQLRELLTQRGIDDASQMAWVDAFPLSYRESCTVAEAAEDLACLIRLDAACSLLPRLIVDQRADGEICPVRLKLYSWQRPVPLSDVLPLLENFGLRVIWQDPTELRKPDGASVWIQAFEIEHAGRCPLPPDEQRAFFEAAFTATWQGLAENDGHHRLVLGAGLDVRRVVILRMLSKYLLQTALPFSQDFLERQLAAHTDISRALVDLFVARFDPALDPAPEGEIRQRVVAEVSQNLDERLEQVATLDADRVLRAYAGVVRAALRTNYFQPAADGGSKPYVSLKLDSSRVPELPAPLPMVEVFVYSPEVEGIHLRGGRVARGGLRWSDRRQDFRTEVLGLMKAQMVKNAIIVPVGAKGGFVVKREAARDREAFMAQGVACYRSFLRGLLDITDNRVGEEIVPPPAVVRHDGDDPYLVVAADKGTASFSDIANALAEEYGFWLGDAFASGGSAGYDHKKMGITARGAWESIKRHFLELAWTDDAGVRHQGRDIQHAAFTVVGIGDMSGDVFGNGMLLSPQIRLLAAFDHRHIFIDPDPDPAEGLAERQRLFALPRSSWADYRADALSAGGGIYPRTSKHIEVSVEAQRALGLSQTHYTPAQLISALLRAPVDLLWNGGIGTYVKSRFESHADCGDRANDALRVNGAELRCKVIGEGGNLGLTQLGRVEAALAGVRLNTDFIDNAGGVHSSDREVNIKIVLNRLMAEGKLERTPRDALLAAMTDDIVHKVLRDNTVQSLAVSLLQVDAAERLDEHANLIRALERDGLLSRPVEFLPDDEQLKQRRIQGIGLTRPELSLLLSYAKLSLFGDVVNSTLPDDPFFDRDLLDYFPPRMGAAHADAIRKHRLRREIVATILANAVVNRMGIAFVHRHAEEHGVGRADVVKAYAMAHEIFSADRYWLAIQALDGRVAADAQLHLFNRAIGLMKHVTTWLIQRQWTAQSVGAAVAAFREAITQIAAWMPDLLPPDYREDWERAAAAMRGTGAPAELADALADTRALGSAPDIVELAHAQQVPLRLAAEVYFELGQQLPLLWLLGSIVALRVHGKWHALARSTLRSDLYRIHRQLAAAVLDQPGESAAARLSVWMQARTERLAFVRQQLGELQRLDGHDFMTLAVAVRELGGLVSE